MEECCESTSQSFIVMIDKRLLKRYADSIGRHIRGVHFLAVENQWRTMGEQVD